MAKSSKTIEGKEMRKPVHKQRTRKPRKPVQKRPTRKPRKQRPHVSFVFNFKKVKRNIHPKFRMSASAQRTMSLLVNNVCERIVIEAGNHMHKAQRKILTPRDIKNAARFLLPKALTR